MNSLAGVVLAAIAGGIAAVAGYSLWRAMEYFRHGDRESAMIEFAVSVFILAVACAIWGLAWWLVPA
jgi:hypothetical protein